MPSLGMYWWSGRRSLRIAAIHARRNAKLWLYLARRPGQLLSNFGDEVSPLLVESITGKKVEWSAPSKAELFAVGSILDLLPADSDAAVWGSGFRTGQSKGLGVQLRTARLLSLRGTGTAGVIGVGANEHIPYGDPGLLVSTLQHKDPVARGPVVLPHFSAFSTRDTRREIRTVADELGAEVLYPHGSPLELAKRIGSAEVVYSSSLHGLVFAISYGVPAVPVRFGLALEPMFKYQDFYSAFGIEIDTFESAVKLAQEPKRRREVLEQAEAHTDRISGQLQGIQEGLVRALERHFR